MNTFYEEEILTYGSGDILLATHNEELQRVKIETKELLGMRWITVLFNMAGGDSTHTVVAECSSSLNDNNKALITTNCEIKTENIKALAQLPEPLKSDVSFNKKMLSDIINFRNLDPIRPPPSQQSLLMSPITLPVNRRVTSKLSVDVKTYLTRDNPLYPSGETYFCDVVTRLL